MLAALLLMLAAPARAGVVRAPLELGRLPPAAASPAVSPAASLPAYLSVASPGDAALLAGVIHAAQASPTAVAVLAQAARLAEVRGRPIIVEVAKMRDGGTFSLDSGILSLRRRDLQDPPRASVATIIHELQHLLQTRRDLPSDLLEAEVEAYIMDFRVVRELNDVSMPGSHDARIQAKFKAGIEPFMGYLRKRYPSDAQLYMTRSQDYEDRLRRGLRKSTSRLERLRGERADKLRVLRQMSRLGRTEAERLSYRQDDIAPLDAKIQTVRRVIEWAEKDIALLADPARRAKIRAYSRSVMRRARAFQKIFSRD